MKTKCSSDTIHIKHYRYGYFRLTFELFYTPRHYTTLADGIDLNDEVSFHHRKKDACIAEMKSWFRSVVDHQQAKHYYDRGYDIEIVTPDILKSARTDRTIYHLTDTKNREQIDSQGLVANATMNRDVFAASTELDLYRPQWIPPYVNRANAVYFHPALGNYDLMGMGFKNMVLYAYTLNGNEKSWVGSLGYGGFALFHDDLYSDNDAMIAHKTEIQTDYAPTYWKYSSSLEDYLKYGPRVRRKDKQVGLDEILLFEPIPSTSLSLIAEWDESGNFLPHDAFEKFVIPKHRQHYLDFLNFHSNG